MTSLVRNRHAVPNALLPVVTLIAINFGFVLSGAIAVETIYSWPGLGLLDLRGAARPDLPMLQGLFLVFSAAVIFFNLIADLAYAYLDPRVSTREHRSPPARGRGGNHASPVPFPRPEFARANSRSSQTSLPPHQTGEPAGHSLRDHARSDPWQRLDAASRRRTGGVQPRRAGMIGLVVLVVIVAMALLAPLLAEPRRPRVRSNTWTTRPGRHRREFPPLGTDSLGRTDLGPVRLRRADQPARRASPRR